MIRRILAAFLLLLSLPTFAQDQVPMADLMRSSGKIYVVVGVLVIIFVGIVVYLWSLDKRLTKMEKQSK
ncbi:MAG TPA: CcmD family protein [Flavobacteriales bacterium]|jgi:CcmD family protein|nr:CcmD family protein [Salibacteraceae bacterium]HAS36024.1 CcmD family protein [Flavobacteriales bacterium]